MLHSYPSRRWHNHGLPAGAGLPEVTQLTWGAGSTLPNPNTIRTTIQTRDEITMDNNGALSSVETTDASTLIPASLGTWGITFIDAGTYVPPIFGTITPALVGLTIGASYFSIGTTYYWINIDEENEDPMPGGFSSGVQVVLSSGYSVSDTCNALISALGGGTTDGSVVTIPQAISPVEGNTVTWAFTAYSPATGYQMGTPFASQITPLDGSSIVPGSYFLMTGSYTGVYFYFRVDDVGVDPSVGYGTNINLSSSDSVSTVVGKMVDVISSWLGASCDNNGDVFRIFFSGTTAYTFEDYNTGFYFNNESQGSDQPWIGFSDASGGYFMWLNQDGLGVDPSNNISQNPPQYYGFTNGFEVNIGSTESASDLAEGTRELFQDGFHWAGSVSASGPDFYLGSIAVGGNFIGDGGGVTQDTTGLATSIVVNGSPSYFTIGSDLFWFKIDGAGNPPIIAGSTYYEVDVISTDDESAVAQAIKSSFVTTGHRSTYLAPNQALAEYGEVTPIEGAVPTGFTFSQQYHFANYFTLYDVLFSAVRSYWFNPGSYIAPPGLVNPVEVDIIFAGDATSVRDPLITIFTANGYTCVTTAGDTFHFDWPSWVPGSAGINIDVNQFGTNWVNTGTARLSGVSPYLTFYDYSGTKWGFYFLVDAYGTAPTIPGVSGGHIVYSSVNVLDDSSGVANQCAGNLQSNLTKITVTRVNNVVTLTNNQNGPVTDADLGTMSSGLTISVIQQGK